jgi:hypothetical protein
VVPLGFHPLPLTRASKRLHLNKLIHMYRIVFVVVVESGTEDSGVRYELRHETCSDGV